MLVSRAGLKSDWGKGLGKEVQLVCGVLGRG